MGCGRYTLKVRDSDHNNGWARRAPFLKLEIAVTRVTGTVKARIHRPEARRKFKEHLPDVRYEWRGRDIFDYVGVLEVDGEKGRLDVRGYGAALGTNGYAPVSAIDYCCLVVWAGNRDCWYVFSPDKLVRLAARKSRGRPAPCPFHSRSVSIGTGSGWCDEDLEAIVPRIIRRGRNRAEKILMKSLQEEVDAGVEPQILSDKYLRAVRMLPDRRPQYVTSYADMLGQDDNSTLTLAGRAMATTMSEEEMAEAERLAGVLQGSTDDTPPAPQSRE